MPRPAGEGQRIGPPWAVRGVDADADTGSRSKYDDKKALVRGL